MTFIKLILRFEIKMKVTDIFTTCILISKKQYCYIEQNIVVIITALPKMAVF